MNKIIKNFFTSGHEFARDEVEQRSIFQMMNIAIMTSSIGYLFGFIVNDFSMLAWFEFSLFLINIIMALFLRKDKKYYSLAATGVTFEGTVLLVMLFYVSSPSEMKHVWIYAYPIVMLYLNSDKQALAWLFILMTMVLIVPLQPFIQVEYTFFQVFYIDFVLGIVSLIVFFYKKKMLEAKSLILYQQGQLQKRIEEVEEKDKILTIQSKQAVMGEMISMIAHQWRQPLSTVTLNISNLQVKKLLGQDVSGEELDKVLQVINETIVYLSDTINDFQTYFNPNKEPAYTDMGALVSKAINFIMPRLKDTQIKVEHNKDTKVFAHTYANEIVQVLLNILNNAVDELIKRGIENPKIIIGLKNEDEHVHISIHDNAGGIAQNDMQYIFEPYYSTKGKNGTGLGLYMSQMIMQKQFDTDIEVQCQNGETLFSIRIPKKVA
ncbi:HAMP domain-containing sensor histidine kinase [Sulfurimonas sp.]|uniref:sensor histidine kinase n=1 Tax=Sulfurimonas sp. TaxID=2022749 RepID=UPI00263893B5|nr:HAMP domain-containing sensor histidine kinase [Sulfurimonas sp.]